MMVKDFALIENGTVTNIIRWDRDDQPDYDYGKESGIEAIEVTENNPAGIGYLYAKGKFSAPPLTEEQKADIVSQTISGNVSLKDNLMSEATQRRDTLQDAVDLEEATDEETTALLLWKKYRVLLSRVDANTANTITWPPKPDF